LKAGQADQLLSADSETPINRILAGILYWDTTKMIHSKGMTTTTTISNADRKLICGSFVMA